MTKGEQTRVKDSEDRDAERNKAWGGKGEKAWDEEWKTGMKTRVRSGEQPCGRQGRGGGKGGKKEGRRKKEQERGRGMARRCRDSKRAIEGERGGEGGGAREMGERGQGVQGPGRREGPGRKRKGGGRHRGERSRERKPKRVKGRGGPLQVAHGTWV